MKQIALSFFFLFFTSVLAYANLSAGPSRLEILIEKNQVLQSTYTLINNYDDDIDINIEIGDWNTYKGNENLSPNTWLKVAPTQIHLKKGETKYIPFEVQTNDSMQGSVSAMVSFSHRPPGNSGILVKISNSIYLTIRGTETVDFEIGDIAIIPQQDGRYKFNTQVNNRGNVHIRPSGNIKIYKKKKLVYQAIIPEYHPTYAGMSSNVLSDNMDLKSLKPGKYTAEVDIVGRNATVKKTIQFRVKKDVTVIQ